MSIEMQDRMRKKCLELAELLRKKNEAYGNSAFVEKGTFSRLGMQDRTKVRMDDKLARIRSGNEEAFGEDTYMDLAGYLIILLVQKDLEKEKQLTLPNIGDEILGMAERRPA